MGEDCIYGDFVVLVVQVFFLVFVVLDICGESEEQRKEDSDLFFVWDFGLRRCYKDEFDGFKQDGEENREDEMMILNKVYDQRYQLGCYKCQIYVSKF